MALPGTALGLNFLESEVNQSAVEKKLAKDSTRFAVLEYQQKLNNWLTAAICGGIIALLIKVYLGG